MNAAFTSYPAGLAGPGAVRAGLAGLAGLAGRRVAPGCGRAGEPPGRPPHQAALSLAAGGHQGGGTVSLALLTM
jgi:hypothetical protein